MFGIGNISYHVSRFLATFKTKYSVLVTRKMELIMSLLRFLINYRIVHIKDLQQIYCIYKNL